MGSCTIISWKHCTSQKLQNSVQLRTVMALKDQEVARNNGTPNYSQLKTAVKLHIEQMMRNRNFKAQNDVVERGSVTESQKGNNAHVERKVGQCFQWKAPGQCSKGDSCSFSHDPSLASGKRGSSSQRRKERSSSPVSYSKAKTDGGKDDKKENSDKRSQILCRYKHCNYPSCKFWHLPVCLNYKSEKGCVYGDKCRFRHVEDYVKPNKESKKRWCERISCYIEGVVSQDYYQRKFHSTWTMNVGIETHRQILQWHLAPNQKLGRKESIAR